MTGKNKRAFLLSHHTFRTSYQFFDLAKVSSQEKIWTSHLRRL